MPRTSSQALLFQYEKYHQLNFSFQISSVSPGTKVRKKLDCLAIDVETVFTEKWELIYRTITCKYYTGILKKKKKNTDFVNDREYLLSLCYSIFYKSKYNNDFNKHEKG